MILNVWKNFQYTYSKDILSQFSNHAQEIF